MGGAFVAHDLSDADRLVKDLQRFNSGALPFAVRNALNAGAFEGRRAWLGELRSTFVLRNTFTARSLRIVKASGKNIGRMQAVLGSVAAFMDEQEGGGTVRPRKGSHKPIPTRTAAGQSPGAGPRTKAVRRGNWMSAIRLGQSKVRGVRSQAQRNAIAMSMASRAGQPFALLRTRRGLGIFRVTGKRRKLRVRMVWDLSRRSVKVPASHTLQHALNETDPKLARLYAECIVEQLRRERVLGY